VVLLDDHGESLCDHGETSHGYFVYESTVHVPPIIHWPDADHNHPQQVDGPGGLIDVAPTLLPYLHISPPAFFEGTDLLADRKRQVYSESAYARESFRWAMLRKIREGTLDYIDAPQAELYDLASDPVSITIAARRAAKSKLVEARHRGFNFARRQFTTRGSEGWLPTILGCFAVVRIAREWQRC
jgi:arylsulfatase A-like enzyme